MSKYNCINILKSEAKFLSRARSISRSQALELTAKKYNFSSYHELQTVAKNRPWDDRLVKAAFGVEDLSDVIYGPGIWDEICDLVDEKLSGEVASTNASGFHIENFDVHDWAYVESDGTLFYEVLFEYAGEQDDSRTITNTVFYVNATVMLARRNGEWEFLSAYDGLELHDVEGDLDRINQEEARERLLFLKPETTSEDENHD